MLPPKKSNFAKQLLNTSFNAEETAPKGIAEVNPVNIANTSESQVIKAESGLTGNFSKTLFGESAEEKSLRQYELEQIKKEQSRIPASGSIEELHQKRLGNDTKFAAFQDREETLNKLENKDTSFFDATGPNLLAPLYWLHDAIVDKKDAWGKTQEEKTNYKELIEKRNRELLPTVNEKLRLQANEDFDLMTKEAGIKKRVAELNDLTGANKVNKDLEFTDIFKTLFTGDSYEKGQKATYTPEEKELKSLNSQLHLLDLAKKQNEEATKKMSDFVEGKTNLWDGLLNSKRDLKTIGVQSLVTNNEVALVAQKLDALTKKFKGDDQSAWNSLNLGEQEVLKAFGKKDNVNQLDLMKNNWWYHTADGVATSLVFVEGMALFGGLGGVLEGSLQGTTSALTKKVLANTVEKTLARKAGLFAARKLLPATADLVGAAVISPSTYSSAARKYIGATEMVTDKDGNQRVLLREGLYNKFMKEYDTNKRELVTQRASLNQKANKTPEDIALLEKIDSDIDSLDAEKQTLTTGKELGWGTALAYGATETMKEYGTEKFVGGAVESGIAKAGEKFLASKLGKAYVGSGVAKTQKYLSGIYKDGVNSFNNTFVGKLSSKAMYHTGAGQVYNGIGGELTEELVTAILPTVSEDYMQQLKQLKDPSFYADVVSQTAMMSGGMATLGLGSQVLNFKRNAKLFDARAAIRKNYSLMDKAVTDSDLAETIIMSTGGTGFSLADYDTKIANLRSTGNAIDAKNANRLEEKKFYNFAIKAIETNTLDEFEKALDKTLKNNQDSKSATNFSAETINNINLAKEKLADLKSTYDRYQDRSNIGNIVKLASQKITNKQSLKHLDEEIVTQKNLAKEEVEGLIQYAGLKDVTFEEINNALNNEVSPEEEQRLQPLLDVLQKENTPALDVLLDLGQIKENLQFAHLQTMRNFNEQVSPAYKAKQEQTKGVQRQISKKIKEVQEGLLETKNAVFNYNNKLTLSKGLIEELFDSVDKMGLSQKEINKIKDDYIGIVNQAEIARHLGSIDRISSLYQDTNNENRELELTPEQQEDIASVEEVDEYNEEEGLNDEPEPIAPNSVSSDIDTPVASQSIDIQQDNLLDIDSPDSGPAIYTNIASEGIKSALGIGPDQNAPEGLDIDSDTSTNPMDDYVLAAPLTTEQFSDENIKALKNYTKDLYNNLEKDLKSAPTFKQMVSHFIKYRGKAEAEQFFNAYKLGWEANNFEPTNYEEVYNDLFDPTKNIIQEASDFLRNIYGLSQQQQEVTEEQVTENSEKQNEEIEEKQSKEIVFTEENVPVRVLGGKRVTSPSLKLGFNALKYIEVKQPDGTFKRITSPEEFLNLQDSFVDFRDLLNPDMYNVGDTLNVAMAPEDLWSSIKISVGRDAEGNPITKTFAEIVKEKGEGFRDSKEFRDTVPMFTYDNSGKPLSYVHDTNWYNVFNVADPSRTNGTIDPNSQSKSHAALIQEGKDTVSKLREAVLNGSVNKITISEKKEGAFFSRAKLTDEDGLRVPLYTIAEANPQAEIVVQVGQGVLEQGFKKPFENNKRKIINKQEVISMGKAGHTWNLRRIGVDPVDGKETWRALMIPGRYPSDEQLETLKWAWSAFSMFDKTETTQNGKKVQVIQEVRNSFIPSDYQLTEDQAKKIIKEVKDITGYNLLRYQDAQDYFKLFMQPKTGDSNAEFGRTIYTKTLGDFSQHTLNAGLSNTKNIALIKAGGVVENVGKPYSEYLKDTLKTDVKSFNVGTEENPVYATSVQPIINFTYSGEEATLPTPQLEIAEVKKASLEAMAEILGEGQDQALIEEAKALEKELGFNFKNMSFAPPIMIGQENLKSIFNTTPGLNLAQEGHLINFVYNYISSAIDVKYKSKVNVAVLMKDLKTSYNEIVDPTREKVDTLLNKLAELNKTKPTEELKNSIENLKTISSALSNIEIYWSKETIKEHLESQNIEYEGQLGILDKAMQEVGKTSDIKQTKDIIDTEEEIEKEQDVTQTEKNYAENSSLTESGKQKTSYRLRRFMSGLTRIDDKGNAIKGFLGLPDYVNYNEVYDTIYQLLGAGVYIESDYDSIKAKILEMEDAQPWVKELMAKFDKADMQLRKELVYNYRRHAVSMKFVMYNTSAAGSSLQVYDTNANELTRVIINGWKNNFKTSPLVMVDKGEYGINQDVAKSLQDRYNSWGNEGHLQSDEEVRDWMAHFGLEFSDKYWRELKEEGFMLKGKNIPYSQIFKENTPIGLLSKYLTKVIGATDTNFDTNEALHPFKDMQSIMKSLSKGQSKYTSKILSKSFRDAGKNISGITNPTYATDRIDDLKRAALTPGSTLITDLQSLSLSSNSILLELLTQDPEFASKFEVNHLGLTALKQYGKKSNNFSAITDLNNLDHDITKLGMFQDTQQGTVSHRVNDFTMRIGRMFLPTMSDKSQMLTLSTGVFNFMQESKIAFEYDSEGDLIFSADLKQLLYDRLIYPEMKRISNFHTKVKSTNIKDYDKAAQLFNFIPALNNVKDKNGDRVIEHLALMPLDKVEEKFKDSLTDIVEEVMHSLASQKMAIWENFKEKNAQGETINLKFFDNKYLAKGEGNLDDKFKTATYDFVLNSVLTNADTFSVIAGDPAMFNQDKLFKGVEIPFKALDDSFYTDLAQKQGVNIGKRLALLAAPGIPLADSKGKIYKQVFLKDAEEISSNSKYLIALYAGKEALVEKIFENGTMTVEQAIDDYNTATPAQKEIIRKGLGNKFPKIADYFSIESTDAQEYTTTKEHIEVLLGQGRISEEMYKNVQDKLDKGEILEKAELEFVMQPIKPVSTGQVIDKEQDVARTVYIKSSSFPLLPQLTAGLAIDDLRVKLEELEKTHGVSVRASYQTANKVGSMKNAVDPLNKESLKELETTMLTLDRGNFKIQQDVPFKSDSKKEDKIAMGTQFFKLLFGDGMLNQKGFKLNEGDAETMTGQELYSHYNTVFKDLVDLKRKGLYKELGLNEEGEVTNPEVSTKKLQDLLQKEAIKRDYPLQDIKGLEIDTLYDKQGNPYYEFKVPLWLASNSNRYESLLNAIVTNRLMNHKIPGNSFVVGSENGFKFKENLEGIDQSKIVFLDNWNGKELQGVSSKTVEGEIKFQKAQVFVPSKFKNEKGALIDLFEKVDGEYKYLLKRENGTLGLKPGMIDPSLLSGFSFRTPTSAHVSGSTIEIAGILPPESGDLMIVPKNFTKQKGLDFDVDKENMYQLNHLLDNKTGKIEVLNEKHKERGLKRLSRVLEEIDLEKVKLQRKLAPEEMVKIITELAKKEKVDLAGYFGEGLLEKVLEEEKSAQDTYDKIEADYNQKLLENEFIKVHNAVFNNPDKKVQAKINKVLSMDFAKSQAELIEGFTKQASTDKVTKELESNGVDRTTATQALKGSQNNFTILSDEYQKQKMGLGSAGKLAIGIYSNYVTFHALTQQTPRELRLTETGEFGPIPKAITIGDITSDGIIGKEMTLDGSRSIAEAFAERQNTATDNEKEQILGRVNINKTTIGVDSLLALLGFDKVNYTDKNGEKQDLSVSYALLSQPIIKQYVEALNNSKGITADFQEGAELKIINALIETYSEGDYYYANGTLVDSQTKEETNFDSDLTGDDLVNGIKYNGENPATQLAALVKFLELDTYAKNIVKIQSTLFTDNLGKSILDSNAKYEDLKTFSENGSIANVKTLIGEFIPANEDTTRPEGYITIGDYYVKPTTPQGQIVVNGLTVGQNLWGGYFPYNDMNFNKVLDEIILTANIDTSSNYKVIEAKQDIIEDVRKFIFSWKGLGLYTEDATKERARLFMDSPTNTSLANYLNANLNDENIVSNKLLNRFTYEIETNGLKPSLIKYNNTISDNLEEKQLYNSIAELIIEDKPLPDWNGKPFSTKQLGQELITYAYVEGGVQQAVQFIKYIPVEYLSEVGLMQEGEFVSANTLLQRVNVKRNPNVFRDLLGFNPENPKESTFMKQYFQHSPEKATQYSEEKVKQSITFSPDKKSFILNEEGAPKFISIRNKTTDKLKQAKFNLYEHVGLGKYQKISVLGINGMNEYELGNRNVKSLLEKEVLPEPIKVTNANINLSNAGKDVSVIQTGQSPTQVLQSLILSSDPKLSRYKILAEILLPMVKDGTEVKVTDTLKELGVFSAGAYLAKSNTIYIDSSIKGDNVGVFIHELIHAMSLTELKKYYDLDEEGYYTKIKVDAPSHVVALNVVWNEFRKSVPNALILATKNKNRDMKNGIVTAWSVEEREIGYPALDIFEFMSVALESEEFQRKMSAIKYKNTDLSLWDKFKEVVTNILKTLNPNITSGSLAEAALNQALNFIEQESEIRKESAIFASLDQEDLGIPDISQKELDELFAEGEENVPKNASIDSEETGPADEALAPSILIEDPFNQNC